MKKWMALLLALLMTLCLPASAEEEPVVNVFTWEDYLDSDTIAAFEAATGIKVQFTNFASNEEMIVRLQANGGSDYDVVIASDYAVSTLRKGELLMPLDKSLLTNWDNLDSAYLGQYYDPEDGFAIPYTAGSPMIVYDPAKTGMEFDSFDDLWDESLTDSVCLIDDARVIIGAVLKTLGYSYNSTDDAELAEAREKLMQLKKNVRVLSYDGGYNSLLTGEVSVGYMFTTSAVVCLTENPDLRAAFVQEGIGFGIDCMMIPVNAPHPNNAHALIDFVLNGDVAAGVAEYQLYISPNAAAAEYMDAEMRELSPFNIPEELLDGREFVQDVGEYESRYQEIWDEFKLG